MSLQQFVDSAITENKEHVEEIGKLRKILESLREPETPEEYVVSVTANT